jgi:hypothetical protein
LSRHHPYERIFPGGKDFKGKKIKHQQIELMEGVSDKSLMGGIKKYV